MEHMKKLFLLAVFVSLGTITYLKFFKNNSYNNEINLLVENHIENYDPAVVYNDGSLTLIAQVLEPAFQYHYLKRPYEIIPLVAQKMPRVTENETRYEILLKKNILYHPHPSFGENRTLKAQDFINQFKRIALKSLGSPFRGFFIETIKGLKKFSENCDSWKCLNEYQVEGLEAQDDFKLVIHLNKPEPNLIYYMTMPILSPVPWELIRYSQNDLKKVLVGTGPYQYSSRSKNNIHLKKFAKYRDDFYPTVGDRYSYTQKLLQSSQEKIPFIDEINFRIIKSDPQKWDGFMERKIDILSVPKNFLAKIFEPAMKKVFEEKRINVKHYPTQSLRWISFNMRDPLLGKKEKVRMAIAHAFNRNEYLEVFSQRTNLKAHTLMVPGLVGYHPAASLPFEYNLNTAKKLMDEAGYPEGKGFPELVYSTRGLQQINIDEGEFVKSQLAQIGLKVRINPLSFNDFLKQGRAGELQLFTDNWLFDYPDGENILQLLISKNTPGINKSGYRNPEFDALYEKLRITRDTAEKSFLMNKMIDLVMLDIPWIPLMYESSYVMIYKNVKNYRKSSINRNYVKYLKIKSE